MDIFDYKNYETKEELFAFIKENKDSLLATKKAVIKEADGFMHVNNVSKASNNVTDDKEDVINRKLVINTTNVLDSHGDVHLPGLWDRSIKNSDKRLLLQEHNMKFDYVIAKKEDVTVSTLDTTFEELGYTELTGNTQALVFDSTIRRSVNEKMFTRYKNGEVDNHSVGMHYVKLVMAINNDDNWAAAEKEVWDKYIDEVRNKEEAEERGYFWVVKEAKVVEGSAVLMGSNQFTPVLDNKNEPTKVTQNIDSSKDTLTKEDIINVFKECKND